MKKNNFQEKNKYFWVVISSWKKVRFLSLITQRMKCYTGLILNGHRYRSILFTSHHLLRLFQGIRLWPSIHIKFILFRAVAIILKITLCTWTSGPNCTGPSLMIILKMLMMTKTLTKTQNFSINRPSQITT